MIETKSLAKRKTKRIRIRRRRKKISEQACSVCVV